MSRMRVATWSVGALLLVLSGCGGGAASGAKAETGGGKDGPGSDGAKGPGEAAEGPSGPTLPSCDDGTCFHCGGGLCPKGFYCDEKAVGGAACSWLPECASDASCGCVEKVLGSECSCTEKSGGVFCQ